MSTTCNGNSAGGDDPEPWFRIPACASAFFALATLTPPSPDPSVSSCHSVDFDDFPIFLVDSVADSSTESSPITQHPGQTDDSVDSSLVSSIPETESYVSICSFGTFGQPRGGPLFNSPLESLTDEEYAMDSLCEYYMSASPFPPPTDLMCVDDSPIQLPQPAPTTFVECSLNIGPGLSDGHGTWNLEALGIQDIVDHPVVRPLLGDHGLAHKVPLRPKPKAPKAMERPMTKDHGHEDRNPNCRPLATVPLKAQRPTPPKRSPRRVEEAEVEFVWLHGISVDLLIDQEGFRSATPSFRYSGVNRSKHDKATCTVTFRSTSRQGYNFHYNPFDSLPILQRVTIHGEESKDYISKQAQLALKANGVYSVHGAEISSLSPLHSRIFNQLGHDPDKLDWEFQYLVEDRIDAHGRVIDGEKKIVPLTFTCSPWLLHPSQGKRVNLIHIFKKGVLGKLTAEKAIMSMGPTPSHQTLAAPPSVSITGSESLGDMTIPSTALVDGLGFKTHRRTKSHAIRDHKPGKAVPLARTRAISSGHRGTDIGRAREALKRGAAGAPVPLPELVRWRASSAGEDSWLSM